MTFFEILFMALSVIFALIGFKLVHYASRRKQVSMNIVGIGTIMVFIAVMLAALPGVLQGKITWPMWVLAIGEIVVFGVVVHLFLPAPPAPTDSS